MCWHKWSKWSVPYNSVRTEPMGSFGDSKTINVVIQERTCEKCFEVDVKVIREGRTQDEE